LAKGFSFWGTSLARKGGFTDV